MSTGSGCKQKNYWSPKGSMGPLEMIKSVVFPLVWSVPTDVTVSNSLLLHWWQTKKKWSLKYVWKENKKKRGDIKKVLSHKRHQATHWTELWKEENFRTDEVGLIPEQLTRVVTNFRFTCCDLHHGSTSLSHFECFENYLWMHQSLIPASFSQWLTSGSCWWFTILGSNLVKSKTCSKLAEKITNKLSKPTNWHLLKKMSHLPVISLCQILSFHTPPRFTRYLEITLTWVIWNSCTLVRSREVLHVEKLPLWLQRQLTLKMGQTPPKIPKISRNHVKSHGMLIPDTVFQI